MALCQPARHWLLQHCSMNYKKPIDAHASPCLNVASVSNSNHYTNMTNNAFATVNDSNLLPVKLSVNWNGKIQLIVSVFNGWDLSLIHI